MGRGRRSIVTASWITNYQIIWSLVNSAVHYINRVNIYFRLSMHNEHFFFPHKQNTEVLFWIMNLSISVGANVW